MNIRGELLSVVNSGNCNGCGACTLIEPQIKLKLNDDGFSRPELEPGIKTTRKQAKNFRKCCPGRTRKAPKTAHQALAPMMGAAVGYWTAYASNPDIRFMASSGGALTAIQQHLLASEAADSCYGVGPSANNPMLNIATRSQVPGELDSPSGSRYAPASTLVGVDLFTLTDRSAVVAKPCEVEALRRTSELYAKGEPLLMSFFCAGIPSQNATRQLVDRLVGETDLKTIRYRGLGWPGNFEVRDEDGVAVSIPYEIAWGENLGREIESLCKICPDGVGRSADIVAADLWDATPDGWPKFADQPGRSLLIARTERGHSVVMNAAKSGCLVLEDADISNLATVQRYQVQRSQEIPGRLLGLIARNSRVPRYSNYHLTRRFIRSPLANLRAAAGMYRRKGRKNAK